MDIGEFIFVLDGGYLLQSVNILKFEIAPCLYLCCVVVRINTHSPCLRACRRACGLLRPREESQSGVLKTEWFL